MTETKTVYVVDDDEAVLLSVRAVLTEAGYRVQCYTSANAFLSEAPRHSPGCVVTDVQMPGTDGLQLQQELLASESVLSIVVVTGVADVPMAVAFMEGGAVTLLEKPYHAAELLQAVERGLSASTDRWKRLQENRAALTRFATLTEVERKVMDCMLAGRPNKSIAQLLDLSMRTVDRRRRAVLEKMQVRSTPELALLVGSIRLSEPVASGLTNAK